MYSQFSEAYDLDGAADLTITTRNPQNRNSSMRSGINGAPTKLTGAQNFCQAKGRGAFYLNTNFHARIARG
jgi:hypothetical protein